MPSQVSMAQVHTCLPVCATAFRTHTCLPVCPTVLGTHTVPSHVSNGLGLLSACTLLASACGAMVQARIRSPPDHSPSWPLLGLCGDVAKSKNMKPTRPFCLMKPMALRSPPDHLNRFKPFCLDFPSHLFLLNAPNLQRPGLACSSHCLCSRHLCSRPAPTRSMHAHSSGSHVHVQAAAPAGEEGTLCAWLGYARPAH